MDQDKKKEARRNRMARKLNPEKLLCNPPKGKCCIQCGEYCTTIMGDPWDGEPVLLHACCRAARAALEA
jgi:hypothetical protein